jgi:hypothetical protein
MDNLQDNDIIKEVSNVIEQIIEQKNEQESSNNLEIDKEVQIDAVVSADVPINLVECPHCGGFIQIIELNCAIFRHGVYKENDQQICPHMPKEICDQLINDDLIKGCGKPFRIVNGVAEICDYI